MNGLKNVMRWMFQHIKILFASKSLKTDRSYLMCLYLTENNRFAQPAQSKTNTTRK